MSTQATRNKENKDALASAACVDSPSIKKDIKNLLSIAKLAKFKKPIFAKANFFTTDFLIIEAKEAFIYLQKALTKAPILRHFDLKFYIRIETNVSEYAIDEVFNQMTLGQLSSNHMTHKNYSHFFKSEID